VAFAALGCALAWLITDVQLNYSGHWNGLFYTGSNEPLPPGFLTDHTWRVRDDRGYDGAFYHLIAHDPLNRRGYLAFVDTPRYRWRRIGIPGIAYLLAAGNDAWIDPAYIALELIFLLLGAFWASQLAQRLGWNAWWGLGFLLIPGVAVSLDRMTVDLPIAALTIAVLWLSTEDQPVWGLYTALALAPLIRETGLILILAWCGSRLIRKRIREAVSGAMCTIPTLLWYGYVALDTQPDQIGFFAGYPFGGLVTWTLNALAHPQAAYGQRVSAALELIALAGIWLAFALAIYLAATRRLDLAALIAILFSAFASLIGYQDIWASAYGIGRTLSPLLIGLAILALRDRRLIFAAPMLLIVPRIALQFAAEIRVALQG